MGRLRSRLAWEGAEGFGFGVVVDAVDAEAEEFEEFALVACEVGVGGEFLGGDFVPDLEDGGLDVFLHFPVVDADPAFFVELRAVGGAVVVGKEALDLLDGAFVVALFFHHFVEDGDVEGNDGDGGAGLGDEGFVDGDEGGLFAKLLVHGYSGLFEVFFGAANGAVGVDVPGDFGPNVGVGYGAEVVGEDACLLHGVDPHFPVFAAHDFDGVGDFLLGGGFDGDFFDEGFVGIEGVLGVGVASGLEDGAVGFAVGGVGAAGGGEGVDDHVDLTEVFFDGGDDLFLHFVGEGVAIEAASVESSGFCFFFEGDAVVPTRGAGLPVGAFFFEEDAHGGGTSTEGGDDSGGEAIASGRANHEDFLGGVIEGGLAFDVVDLLLDVSCATVGVGSGADESANLWFENWHRKGV